MLITIENFPSSNTLSLKSFPIIWELPSYPYPPSPAPTIAAARGVPLAPWQSVFVGLREMKGSQESSIQSWIPPYLKRELETF